MKFLLAGGVAGAGTESFTLFGFPSIPRLTAQNQCRGRPPHRLIVSGSSSSRALRTSTRSRRTPSCIPNAVYGPSAAPFSRSMPRAVLLGSGSGMASISPRSFPYVPTCFCGVGGSGRGGLMISLQESAIKFLSYESSVSQSSSSSMLLQAQGFLIKKRAFAKYVDHVDDSRNISGTSRFLSGGIGGLTSQLCTYLPFWR